MTLNFDVCVHSFEELSKHSQPLHITNTDLNPEVDLITGINGVSFDEAWSESVEWIVETSILESCPVRVLSKSHLILSKKNTGRPVDAADIKGLQSQEFSSDG